MASLNRNPTLQTSWEFFEQIYDHMDKINPSDLLYSHFKTIVKCNEQLPYEAWTRTILSGKKIMLLGYRNLSSFG